MKKIILTLLFLLITSVSYSTEWYVDKWKGDDANINDSAVGGGKSWDSALVNPAVAYAVALPGDTIHINQGVYEFKNDVPYEITLNKANVAFVGYGEVWFEGKGKDVVNNNTMFNMDQTKPNINFISLTNINIRGFDIGIRIIDAPFSTSYLNAFIIENCRIENNNIGILGGKPDYQDYGSIYWFLRNSVFINNNFGFYGGGSASAGQICRHYGFFNLTVYNSPFSGNALQNGYNRYNDIQNCIFFNSNITPHTNQGSGWYNNNFFNSTSSCGYGTNPTYHDPLFNDTNPLNPILTLRRESPVRNLSTTGSFLGAYGVADYSSSNDTNTWSGFYSWITDNDSVSIYSDTAFKIDTNGLTLNYGNEYPKNRRITRIFTNLGTIYGTPLKSFANVNEVFNDGDYKDYWAVIDYDTTTVIREYRYIASNDPITEEDLKENSGKWTTIGFNEPLPATTVRFFAVELYFRYNF